MKKIFFLLMVGGLLFSCQLTDVLEQEPPHNLTPANAITDEKSAETALTGIYGEQIGYESYMSIGNFAMTAGILQRNDNPGVVVSIYYIENRLPELNLVSAAYLPFWNAFNTIVNSSTQLLSVVEGMNDQVFTAGRKTSMMGEIRFLRGMYLFELLRMFGEYDKLDSKYGMIIRETPPDADDVYKARSTVEQTYDFILRDLEYAIANAPDFTSSDYASKMAARALKVKVLFYMGKYPEALEAANTFIAGGERQLVAPYSAVFTDFSNSELIYTRGFAGTDEVKYQVTRVQAYYNEGKWGPTESFVDLVAGDPREEVILKDGVGEVFGPQKTIRKAANQEGTMPTYLMRYSEIYMIKAECEARTGQGDPLATLNALRSGHGLAPVAEATDILQTIYKEWLLEMGFENGHEWYATWRMGVDQLLEMNQAVLKKMNASADPALYKANLPYNRIYPIPGDEISANKLMVQNPGYN